MGLLALDIFGSVPSKKEVVEAVYDLQMISLPTTVSHSVGDEANFFSEGGLDRTPLIHEMVKRESSSGLGRSQSGRKVYQSGSVLSEACKKFLNALHLLWTNSSVKNMVVSLTTDKDVWNAVMKNEMVQEFKKTYHAEKYLKHVEFASRGSQASWADARPDITAQILIFIFGIAKGTVMKFIEDIISLVNKLFDHRQVKNTMDVVSDLVSSSFMLSVLVFIVVILKRNLAPLSD